MHRFAHRRTKFGGPGFLRALFTMWLLPSSAMAPSGNASPSRAALVVFACCLGVCFARLSLAAGVDQFSYQIPFPDSPQSFEEASITFDLRAESVLAALACGSEIEYAASQAKAGEDSTAILIAKLEWATGHPDPITQQARFTKNCAFTRYFRSGDLCDAFDSPNCTEASFQPGTTDFGAQFMVKYFPWPECVGSTVAISLPPRFESIFVPPTTRPAAARYTGAVRGDFSITPACLIKQVNSSLERMTIVGQMGTEGLGCHDPLALVGVEIFSNQTIGDWDVAVRNLTRVAFLDKQNVSLHGIHALGPAALANLHEHLLSASGGPTVEAYPVIGCGNTQEDSGTSQERADERDWTDEPFWQTIGDILLFLLIIFLIALIAYLIGWLLFTALGVGALGGGIAIAVVAIVVAIFISVDTIPETENHLLMINSSSYLKNQMIIEDVPQSSGADRFRKDNAALKEWLLTKMQSIMKEEFIEYNSRPYNRYSIFAIQNIADFANDDDLRTGARLVLEYSFAKFAVGSQQGRRFVPFRRKRKAMWEFIDAKAPKENGLFDLIHAGDQQIALGLMYAGQTDQIRDNFVSFGTAGLGLYAATSSYRPGNLLVDLAINKSNPVFQRFHYRETAEIYSSGRSFLISAGGKSTGAAYGFLFLNKDDDHGVALPTTLFLGKSKLDDFWDPTKPEMSLNRTTLGELIRIDGSRPKDSTADNASYDGNVCVWDGFACGLNVVIPPTVLPAPGGAYDGSGFSDVTLPGQPSPCRVTKSRGPKEKWDFIDSRRCMGYQRAPGFFVVIYRQDCPLLLPNCVDNVGLFEVVDASPAEDFDAFQQRIINANPPGFIDESAGFGGAKGTYKSARGQTIEFVAEASRSEILSVDGIAQTDVDDWSFAEGSALLPMTRAPVTSGGDGLVRITNKPRFLSVELDFRNKASPVRNLK